MDKSIQKSILEFMLESSKNSEYLLDEDLIHKGVHKIYIKKWGKNNEIKMPLANSVRAQLKFLSDSDYILKEDFGYRLTEWGDISSRGLGIKLIWHWLIYRNHNLAILISLISLIISILTFLIK